MSAKVWVLGDAVVISCQNQTGGYCLVLAARQLTCGGNRQIRRNKWVYRSGRWYPFGALMQRTLLTEGVDITYWSKMNGTGHPRCLSIWTIKETFIYVYGPPQCRSFFRDDRLPCWRHGEWLHLCSIALSAELRVPAHLLRWRRSGMPEVLSLRSQYSWRSMARRAFAPLVLRQALQLADVVKLSEEEWRLSVEKHRTIGIYARWQKSMRSHAVGD